MNISGRWYNELGSVMDLQADDQGNIIGTYHTAVGKAESQYVLVGRYDQTQQNGTIGWVVNWSNQYGDSYSVTSWSGQFQTIQNNETLVTMWLLTNKTNPKDDWASTLVGQDVFTRVPPTEQTIQSALKMKRHSHPDVKNRKL